eukprot:4884734-Prymnesium_polylepis.1
MGRAMRSKAAEMAADGRAVVALEGAKRSSVSNEVPRERGDSNSELERARARWSHVSLAAAATQQQLPLPHSCRCYAAQLPLLSSTAPTAAQQQLPLPLGH